MTDVKSSRDRHLDRFVSINDVERAASRRLPRPIWDMIAGGSGDEVTLDRNRAAFSALTLRPEACVDVTHRDLSTMVLGERVSMPLLVGPTGFQRMADRHAELAVARAAGEAGTLFSLSTISSYPFEEVAEAASGPRWFQLYPAVFAGRLKETLEKVRAAGFYALCVTVDSAVSGIRERDVRNQVTIPLKIGPRLVYDVALRPRWALDFVRGGVGQGSQGMGSKGISYADAVRSMQLSAKSVTLADIAEIRKLWSGPLVVKGVLRGEDCAALLNLGVDGIVVSNHGGRFLDTVPATINVLPEIVDAVDGRAEVFLDGGIRRGVDVVKALALGARACFIGRPYIYGLAVGSQAGVGRVLDILRMEIDRTLALIGCCRPGDVDRSHVGLNRMTSIAPASGKRPRDGPAEE